jgi:hypothetical protein
MDESAYNPLGSRQSENRSISENDHLLFIGAFSIGIGVLCVVRLVLDLNASIAAVALLAIEFLYFLIIRLSPKFTIRADRAADNIYFLGFMYTVSALGISLYKFSTAGMSSEDLVSGVVGDLAVGLISTIGGLFFRVLLLQMRTDPHEHEEHVRIELSESAAKVKVAISNVNLIMDQTALMLKDSVDQSVSETEGMLKATRSKINKLSKSADQLIEKLETKLAATDLSDTLLVDLFYPAVEKLNERVASVFLGLEAQQIQQQESHHKRIDSQLTQIHSNFTNILQLKMEAIRNDLKVVINEASKNLVESLSSRIEIEKVDFSPVVQSIDDTLSLAVADLSRSLEGTTSEILGIGEKIAALSRGAGAGLAAATQGIEESLSNHAEFMDRLKRDLEKISTSYVRTIDETAKSMRNADGRLQAAVIETNRTSLAEFSAGLTGLVERLAEIDKTKSSVSDRSA